MLLSLYLRVAGQTRSGLGFNETIHVYAAKSILEKGLPELPSGKIYDRALLFTQSVALSFKLFGVSELSARLPSIVFGALSVILVFFIGRGFGSSVGLIAALLMAFMPFEVGWSRACRMYSMYQFFFLLTLYSFYRGFEPDAVRINAEDSQREKSSSKNFMVTLLRNLNWTWLVLSGIFAAVALNLQPLILLFGVSTIVYLLCMSFISSLNLGFRQAIKDKYFISLILILAFVAVLLAIPSFSAKVQDAYHFSPSWASYLKVSPYRYIHFLIRPTLFPIFVLIPIGAVQLCLRENKYGSFIVISTLVPLFFHSFIAKAQDPRYIYDIFPLMLIISGYTLSILFDQEWKAFGSLVHRLSGKLGWLKRLTPFAFSALILVFLVIFGLPLKYSLQMTNPEASYVSGEFNGQWRTACEYVDQFLGPDDVVVTSIPLAAQYYGCRNVEYSLDNGEIDQFREIDGEAFRFHPFANTKAITNLEELKTVLSAHSRGWLLLDKQRFVNPATLPPEVKEYIESHLHFHTFKGNKTIRVFSWGVTAESKMTPEDTQ